MKTYDMFNFCFNDINIHRGVKSGTRGGVYQGQNGAPFYNQRTGFIPRRTAPIRPSRPSGEKYEAIRNQLDKLLEYATAIDKASLPEEYASRDKESKELSTLSISQINKLHEMGAKLDEEMFEAKSEEMHANSRTLPTC